VDEDDAPFDTAVKPAPAAQPAADAGGANRAQDILAMIRNRKQ
jgi:hypothetical protein